jgi:hypothetical protein
MKRLKLVAIICVLALFQMSGQAQEKKIKFNKGVLKICSAKNFQITGYDGDEVIIKSLHNKGANGLTFATSSTTEESVFVRGTARVSGTRGNLRTRFPEKKDSGQAVSVAYFFDNQGRKKGLKKLGKKYENTEYGIYFTITQKDGELIFEDQKPKSGTFVMYGNERYEIKIPNSLKLEWKTNFCDYNPKEKKGQTYFYNSTPSSLSNFDGEVEIESSLTNIKLSDVTGPVTINTIGGNVTVEFDKKKPQRLYSIYSNNGFIDVQIPNSSSILVDATGKAVYSDVDFKILDEVEVNDFGHIQTQMKLKLGSGKTKMKLDANYGNIYLRKK